MIKPLKAIYVQSNKGTVRATLKRKIAEFSEDKRFLEAEKWESKAPTSDGTPALELLGKERGLVVVLCCVVLWSGGDVYRLRQRKRK